MVASAEGVYPILLYRMWAFAVPTMNYRGVNWMGCVYRMDTKQPELDSRRFLLWKYIDLTGI